MCISRIKLYFWSYASDHVTSLHTRAQTYEAALWPPVVAAGH